MYFFSFTCTCTGVLASLFLKGIKLFWERRVPFLNAEIISSAFVLLQYVLLQYVLLQYCLFLLEVQVNIIIYNW